MITYQSDLLQDNTAGTDVMQSPVTSSIWPYGHYSQALSRLS